MGAITCAPTAAGALPIPTVQTTIVATTATTTTAATTYGQFRHHHPHVAGGAGVGCTVGVTVGFTVGFAIGEVSFAETGAVAIISITAMISEITRWSVKPSVKSHTD
jgi:uncharacterized membrane protein YfcA